MAKQQGSGVVAAARRVSDTQGRFQDVGSQFMSGYDKAMEAKKKREEQNQAIQSKANAYIDQFEGYVDLADFNDEDKKLVKSQVINYRNEFIDAANNAAKIKDKSGAEYQMYMDQMNDAQNKMVKLRGNLEGLANLKVELADNFKAKNVYSNSQKNSENLLKANAILEGSIASIGDDGSLNFKGYTVPDAVGGGEGFTVDDFSYSTKSFKKPFEVATNEANAILGLANREETLKGQVTENQEKIIRSNVANILANDDALYSILSSSELQLIPLDGIDPDDPNAREQAINMLTQGIIDSRGAGLIKEPGTPGKTKTTKPNRRRQNTASVLEYEKQAFKPTPGAYGPSRGNDVMVITTSTGTPYDVQMVNGKWLLSKGDEEWVFNTFDAMKAARTDLFE